MSNRDDTPRGDGNSQDAPRVRVERPLPAEGQAPRITELWAWTCIDPLTDVEGIIAARPLYGGGTAMPLVGATRTIVEKWELYATAAAREAETTARLRRFTAAGY